MKTHGDSRTRLYKIYYSMKSRCYGNWDKRQMKNYRDRGITICDEWLNDYPAFRDWAMQNGYNDTLTIERIDNDKGYSPDNCKWIPLKEQAANRRTNYYITIDDETHTMAEWCRRNNVSRDAACKRIEAYGWDPVLAVTTPTRAYEEYGRFSRKRKADEWTLHGKGWKELEISYNGQTLNAEQWSDITGIPAPTIRWRLKNNWSAERALTEPVHDRGQNMLASKVDGT